MEYIKKEELIKDEIYKASSGSLTYIMKATKDLENVKNIPKYSVFMKHGGFNGSYLTFTNATSEEKHWLEACIQLDKFIEYEEAMKSFIPEYVECVKGYSSHIIKNYIYKVVDSSDITSLCLNCNIKSHYSEGSNLYVGVNEFSFKPSTKEAYDAQFKTKELIKVKPFEILSFKAMFGLYNKENDLYRYELSNVSYTLENLLTKHTSIVINSVINEEGNIFMINDTITTLEGVNKGKSFTITGFRLNKAKTMICAITNAHSNGVGIDKIEHFIEKKVEKPIISNLEQWLIKTKALNLSLVELDSYINSGTNCNYYEIFNKLNGHLSKGKAKILFDEWNKEIVIEETLLEKAKRLYPVGAKFKSAANSQLFTVKNHNEIHSSGLNICFSTIEMNNSYDFYGCIRNSKGEWAEIIEDKPKVGDKFKFKQHDRGNFIIDSIKDSTDGEIIFYNQDEKYNKNHNRVLLKNITIIK